MVIKLSLAVSTLLLCGCSPTRNKGVCRLSADLDVFPKHGHDSKLMDFKRIAATEISNAVLKGTLVDLAKDTPVDLAIIQVKNQYNDYKVLSDSIGHFYFDHIQEGNYRLEVISLGYRSFVMDNIYLDAGDFVQLKVGMGFLGQDDFVVKNKSRK